MDDIKKTMKEVKTVTPKTASPAPMKFKVQGKHLCTVDSDVLLRFITKATGVGFQHVALRFTKSGIWVRQLCSMTYRCIIGELKKSATTIWDVTDEELICIGNFNKFKEVLQKFDGQISLSINDDDLVIQNDTMRFKYVLSTLSTIKEKQLLGLQEERRYMEKDAQVACYELESSTLFEFNKMFPLTEAKIIKFNFDENGVTTNTRDRGTHGLEMSLKAKTIMFKPTEKFMAPYTGDGLKEVIERLTTPKANLCVSRNKEDLSMISIHEEGENWTFTNYIAPVLSDGSEE